MFLLYFAYISRIQVSSLVWIKGEIQKHDLVRNADTGIMVFQESLQIRLRGRPELFRVKNASAETFLLAEYKKSSVAEVELLVRFDESSLKKGLPVQIFSLKIEGQTLLRTEDVIAAEHGGLKIMAGVGGLVMALGAGLLIFARRPA